METTVLPITFNSKRSDHPFNDRRAHNQLEMPINNPIKVWGTREGIEEQQGALVQAINLANHPLTGAYVALMPDFHPGYGMPIGGVAALQGGVIPNAVGNDIGCGMMAAKTNIFSAEVSTEQLGAWRKRIHELIPCGPGAGGVHIDQQSTPTELTQGFGGLDMPVVTDGFSKALHQLGTLGGGNHFIEAQVDHETGALWVMLHSGSRGIGERIKDFYHKKALDLNSIWRSELPTPELAFLPTGTEWYSKYMIEMDWAMKFAEQNRHAMLQAVGEAFLDTMGFSLQFDEIIETHHNYAAMENWFNKNYLVHRKGAVKASGKVIIPGSMGTCSYICEGLNNPTSFGSCSHGAGRLRSRKATTALYTLERAQAEMHGIVFGVREGQYDEMPGAYKDVHEVIRLQRDLVVPVNILHPLMVVKG